MRKIFSPANVLVLLFPLRAVSLFAQDSAPFPPPPESVREVAVIGSKEEPGERLTIRGTVYRSDGKSVAAGIIFYLYQTDVTGVYNRTNGSYRSPRLRGWLKTDKSGRYEIRTIKPGSYPGGRTPAHIHITVKVAGNKSEWLDSFLFEGDPFLSKEDQERPDQEGSFSCVLRLHKISDGTWEARRDILLSSPNRND